MGQLLYGLGQLYKCFLKQKSTISSKVVSLTMNGAFIIKYIITISSLLSEYSTPPEPLCPVLRVTHSVESYFLSITDLTSYYKIILKLHFDEVSVRKIAERLKKSRNTFIATELKNNLIKAACLSLSSQINTQPRD